MDGSIAAGPAINCAPICKALMILIRSIVLVSSIQSINIQTPSYSKTIILVQQGYQGKRREDVHGARRPCSRRRRLRAADRLGMAAAGRVRRRRRAVPLRRVPAAAAVQPGGGALLRPSWADDVAAERRLPAAAAPLLPPAGADGRHVPVPGHMQRGAVRRAAAAAAGRRRRRHVRAGGGSDDAAVAAAPAAGRGPHGGGAGRAGPARHVRPLPAAQLLHHPLRPFGCRSSLLLLIWKSKSLYLYFL
jgi:hypothetical protein